MAKSFGHEKAKKLVCAITSLEGGDKSVSKLKADKTNDTRDNKLLSKQDYNSSSHSKSQSLFLYQTPQKIRGCFDNNYKPVTCRGCNTRSNSHELQQRSAKHSNLEQALALGLLRQAWSSIGCQGCSFAGRWEELSGCIWRGCEHRPIT